MEAARAFAEAGRHFFRISAPALAMNRAMRRFAHQPPLKQRVILNLEPELGAFAGERNTPKRVQVIPFPLSTQWITSIALDENDYSASTGATVEVLVPRTAFDQLADQHGAERIKHLPLRPGIAVGDNMMSRLGACLDHVLENRLPENPPLVDQIGKALTSHLAQRYGGMRLPGPRTTGGLSSWQLRLARNAFNANLSGTVSLEQVAEKCGLSVNHFSRAFSRSTGLSPHRWLMQRRIEAAKDMVLEGAAPLAQIALNCGFSDQSHFTRSFSKQTGLTPRRWRAAQEGGWETNGESQL